MTERICNVVGCERPHRALGWCNGHYLRWKRYGDLGPVAVAPESRPAELNHFWRGDEVGYYAMHKRVRRARGRASAHACRRCGVVAQQWAYDHHDPGEKQSPEGFTYSTDPERYVPLCVACHHAFDAGRACLDA